MRCQSWRKPCAGSGALSGISPPAASASLIFSYFSGPLFKRLSPRPECPGSAYLLNLPRAAPPAAMSSQALISGALKAKELHNCAGGATPYPVGKATSSISLQHRVCKMVACYS